MKPQKHRHHPRRESPGPDHGAETTDADKPARSKLLRLKASKLRKPRPKKRRIFQPSEISSYLAAAQRLDRTLAALLALGAFAGLRRLEMRELPWSHVTSDFIQIASGGTKSRKSRSIPIHPTLRRWLDTIPRGEAEQPVVPPDFEQGLRKLQTRVGVSPANSIPLSVSSLRLTHVSYVLAEAVLREKPRRSCAIVAGGKITKPDVAAYWAISPESPEPRRRGRNQPPKSS
jgi:integrase